ncbi:MAG: ABC transporter permease subunit [Planctomycetota bacterium]|jgi:ABC-type phosphate transport system permease subunit|nr:MAG: ABC transporter permease subunit [Planctomycetota bacterium]
MIRSSIRRSARSQIAAQGEPMVWLSGGMFAIACLMIVSLLAFVLWQGLWTLWPRTYSIYGRKDGTLVGGELYAKASLEGQDTLYLRTGNYDVSNQHFAYVSSSELVEQSGWLAPDLWLVERKEWGNLYGFPKQLSWSQADPEDFVRVVHEGMRQTAKIDRELGEAKNELKRIDQHIAEARLGIRRVELAEKIDLQRAAETGSLEGLSPSARDAVSNLGLRNRQADETMVEINDRIAGLEAQRAERTVVFELPILDPLGTITADWADLRAGRLRDPTGLAELLGAAKDSSGLSFSAEPMGDGGLSEPGVEDQRLVCKVTIPGEPTRRLMIRRLEDGRVSVEAFREHSILLADMVRFFPTNRLGIFQRLGVYASRWWEFLSGDPREAGMEGGFFPAIWGTVVMTIVMSLAVMPFGVLAALYMREYAKSGWLLSVIRISINNLAGVPSIVYGVFGLSFFCYIVGGYIDGGPIKAGFEPWPSAAWFSALGGLAIVGLIAFAVSIFSGQAEARRSPLRTVLSWSAGLLWLLTLGLIVWLLVKSPHFHGFYEAQLPNPTFGKGCLLWAALTLSLLTLPVVIVATEEALSAVPNSLREGSYACGAGKWQTIHRIVLPYARPGIITGFILAMARGAGEVAPMMLVGAIPLATELPLDGEFPFLHGSRSFMHLGFQIYSLGFQSQNSEAAKPMVFTATLLLLSIVTVLNQTAIWLRASLRKRFQSSQF